VLFILLVADWTKVTNFFSIFFTSFGDGSGRLQLYKLALEVFQKYPIFGEGFYVELSGDPGFAGIPLIPDMYHDTFMELLAATGAVGLITYGIHRATTVISYIKNITVERTYIAFIIVALLFLNLFDNHIFYMFPSLIYGFLIGILVGSEDKELMLRNEKMLSGKDLSRD
jgi:O-antigen ligase